MHTDEHRSALNKVTEGILGCAFEVLNTLGCGFLEKVYENAMVVALRKSGLRVRQQVPFKISFQGEVVGEYIADLLVEDAVLVELKAAKALDDIHLAQCINYLKASGLKICLLLNFGRPKLEIKRIAN